MKLLVDNDASISVDRTGSSPGPGMPQGFEITIDGLWMVFENENRVIDMAIAILDREGFDVSAIREKHARNQRD